MMMRDRSLQKKSMLALFTALLLVGCGASSPPVEFYTLNSISNTTPQENSANLEQDMAIGVGPVNIPKVLDRPQIVTRTGPNKLKMDEFHRWAGPLKEDFSRVLAENLSTLLATDRVAVYPWEIDFKPRYRIALNIRYFEGQLDEEVVLDVVWRVSGQESQKVLTAKTSLIKEPVSASDYDALVAAKSQAVAKLSREIADEIRKFESGG